VIPIWVLLLLLDTTAPQPSAPTIAAIACYQTYKHTSDACETYSCSLAVTYRYQSCIRSEPFPI